MGVIFLPPPSFKYFAPRWLSYSCPRLGCSISAPALLKIFLHHVGCSISAPALGVAYLPPPCLKEFGNTVGVVFVPFAWESTTKSISVKTLCPLHEEATKTKKKKEKKEGGKTQEPTKWLLVSPQKEKKKKRGGREGGKTQEHTKWLLVSPHSKTVAWI